MECMRAIHGTYLMHFVPNDFMLFLLAQIRPHWQKLGKTPTPLRMHDLCLQSPI